LRRFVFNGVDDRALQIDFYNSYHLLIYPSQLLVCFISLKASDDPNYLEDHVYVITMGGTIDKDYPKLTSGYAFEFGNQSAAERILKNHPNLGITYTIKSICKKDSLEITQQDRSELANAIAFIIEERKYHAELVRIVVTHGTDTLIDTAMFIKNCFREEDRVRFVIAFTGATKPERFVDSDASFNVGCAVAATSFCNGVVICMNGNVIPVEHCVRDEVSGLFRRKNK